MGGYTGKYFRGHFFRDRLWEIEIGKNIVETLKIKSVLDLGCGIGAYIEGCYRAGCLDVIGIDLNIEQSISYTADCIKGCVRHGDVTLPMDIKQRKYDCCLSIETAEHLSPTGSQGFVDNLVEYSDKYIIMTAASHGQSGTGHINLREKEFWRSMVEDKGFVYKESLTGAFKKIWGDIEISDCRYPKVPNFIMNNLMVFLKG